MWVLNLDAGGRVNEGERPGWCFLQGSKCWRRQLIRVPRIVYHDQFLSRLFEKSVSASVFYFNPRDLLTSIIRC
jgi:hypothetical protein